MSFRLLGVPIILLLVAAACGGSGANEVRTTTNVSDSKTSSSTTSTTASLDTESAANVSGDANDVDIGDVVVLCAVLDRHKDELAEMAGFSARSDTLAGTSDEIVGSSLCHISGGAGATYVEVMVFTDPTITIELAAQSYDGVSAAPELGEDAVYVALDDPIEADMVLFSVGNSIVRVESAIGWASIPRDDLIEVSQRVQQILTEAG